jgi:hypothetical protein
MESLFFQVEVRFNAESKKHVAAVRKAAKEALKAVVVEGAKKIVVR